MALSNALVKFTSKPGVARRLSMEVAGKSDHDAVNNVLRYGQTLCLL